MGVNADIKERYLEKYGTTTEGKVIKNEKPDTVDYDALYNEYLDEIIMNNEQLWSLLQKWRGDCSKRKVRA